MSLGRARFLEGEAASIGLPCEVVECVKGKPILVITWTGNLGHLSNCNKVIFYSSDETGQLVTVSI